MKRIVVEAGAAAVIRTLEEAGYQACAVGGCVRDSLMGRTPKDWDVTTSALPEEIKSVFPRTFDTGIQHGTVSVREQGRTYEVTTYRVDGTYGDHRRPDYVKFTGSLREDLSRRDFTINAMAYHPERGLTDYFGGVQDLERGLIRCVGEARERFEEDALRMLRALRFSARLGFEVEESTWAAVKEKAPLLANVSRERVEEELNQILLSDHPERMEAVWDTGLMAWCIPDFSGEKYDWQALRAVPAERVLRWAVCLRDFGSEDTDRILRDLKFDNAARLRLVRLAAFRSRSLPWEPEPMRRFLHELGRENFMDLFQVKKALGEDETVLEAAREQYEAQKDCCLTVRELALDGRALRQLGVPEGPAMGALLNALLDRVLRDPSLNTRELLTGQLEDLRSRD